MCCAGNDVFCVKQINQPKQQLAVCGPKTSILVWAI